MSMETALKETFDLARQHGLDDLNTDDPYTEFEHLLQMRDHILFGELSEAKANRHLGWIQACIYINAMGSISLEQLKDINRRNL